MGAARREALLSRDIIVTRDGTKDRAARAGDTHVDAGEGRKVIRISLLFPDCRQGSAPAFHLCTDASGSRIDTFVVSVACLH